MFYIFFVDAVCVALSATAVKIYLYKNRLEIFD